MRGINSTTDDAQNYRLLFVAKINTRDTPATGALAGKYVYGWTEQAFSTSTGTPEDAQPARTGVYTSETSYQNCLIDANNTNFAIGSYVWIKMKGQVGGQTVYESVVNTEVEIVRVTTTRNSDGDYLGYVQLYDGSMWSDGEAVWIRDAN